MKLVLVICIDIRRHLCTSSNRFQNFQFSTVLTYSLHFHQSIPQTNLSPSGSGRQLDADDVGRGSGEVDVVQDLADCIPALVCFVCLRTAHLTISLSQSRVLFLHVVLHFLLSLLSALRAGGRRFGLLKIRSSLIGLSKQLV